MIEDMDERKYWLAFSICSGIGPVRFHRLLNYFGSATKAWDASLQELIDSGIGKKMAQDVLDFKKTFTIEKYEERMQKLQVTYLTLQDAEYPQLLKAIKNPPIVLYKKGTYTFNKKDTLVSVVGTRKITEYGKEVTELLVSDLVRSGCVIVSGLALGVDARAHQSTIAASGKTIAVLGSGVDVCTPEENSGLYNRIIETGGAIVSEYPLGMMANKGSFPARNRIIAGLSLGVLVTEGAEDSGSLITARDAFTNNRKVFAVPGPITSSVSKGPISLIAKGATMVMTAKDIIDELGIKGTTGSTSTTRSMGFKNLTKEEQKIIDLLQDQKLHFDELVKKTGLYPANLGALLSLMEMKRLVKSSPGGFWQC
jgi:DNA processing protein